MQQFRIPPELKETVTVMRESAFERGDRFTSPKILTIAEDVKCLVAPSRDFVHLQSGVPVELSGWMVLLEQPNSEITDGDFLVRSDGSKLKVHGVRDLGDVMCLEIRDETVP